MKARLKILESFPDRSFNLQLTGHYHSYNELHYHAELELIYVIEGTGTLLVGNRIEQVNEGDLFLIGRNVPHMFRFETYIYQNPLLQLGRMDAPLQLLTLHFNPDVFGSQFINLPENRFIQNVIKKAEQVQQFYDGMRNELVTMLNQLLKIESHGRLFLLMQLLARIAEGKEYRFLAADTNLAAYNNADETRLTKIYLYTLNNFHHTIKLKEIAATVYMVPNAFCRYFKQRTNKSYFDFLLEVRINHAQKLLKESDYSMVVISYESGFTNLSNFNRYFKALTGSTPLQSRKAYRSLAR
ncbi:AraC-like DNA-binding protein [Mucilaginibacter yixingensis]|uniref:AraC-like DNA-binding protein n=1 Tax=Mucilaginibacter yixingensis TaxID=1295612 RepID=A0A2T5J6B2_9SPHI|nr:AraC family transcriptional regulator [Mucilaginibacter yixingensis]PTQ94082.1 AraC-like DNA-binding protein [Mucilaginibacter yixingensis]